MINGTAASQERSANVLVITGDAEVKSFINNLMLLKRIRAGITESMENAAHFLKSNAAPDIVILDLDLSEPIMVEFVRQIRGQKNLARLPVLVLTSFPDPTLVREALDAGANRYLTKMFMSQNLLPTLQEMIRQLPLVVPKQTTGSLRQSAAISTDSGG